MKGVIIQVVFTIIGSFFLTALIYYSFFSTSGSGVAVPRDFELKVGEYQLENSGSGGIISTEISFSDISKDTVPSKTGSTLINTGSINDSGMDSDIFYKNGIDLYSTIYSNTPFYEVSNTDELITVSIKDLEGDFIFDFKNVSKKVLLSSDIYEVYLENNGMLYIHNSKERATIASFSSLLELDFINQNTSEKTINTFLFPHMYLEFNKQRFKLRKGLDSLRVSQLGTLGYFYENFLELQTVDKIPFTQNEKQQKFVQNSLTDFLNQQIQYITHLNILQKTTVKDFPGSRYISKYFSLFYNKEKKSVFYKNMILRSTYELLNLKKVDPQVSKKIRDDLENLKLLDIQSYEKISNLIEKMYIYGLYDIADNQKYISQNLGAILSKGIQKNVHGSIPLQHYFDRYNFIGDKQIYRILNNNHEQKLYGDFGDLKYEYYLEYLRQMVLFGFKNTSNVIELEQLILLFSIGTNDLKKIVNNSDNADRIVIASNINNYDMLSILKEVLLENFFEGREESGLLKVGTQNINGLAVLKQSVQNIDVFHQNSKSFLEEKGSKYNYVVTGYKELFHTLEEYFSALGNYSLYQKDYSASNQKLLTAEVYKEEEEGLSEKALIKYLGQFSEVSTANMTVKIVDDYYYDISGMGVKNGLFSLKLYPYDENRILDINLLNNNYSTQSKEGVFYEELKNITLDLNIEEEKYKRLFSKAKDEDKDKYDFSKVLLTKLHPVTREGGEIYTGGDYGTDNEEDQVISVFKSAKLLGKSGEFKIISDILEIKYKDLNVQKAETEFKITIDHSTLKMFVNKGGKNMKMYADLNAMYKLDGNNHYFFNTEVLPYTLSRNLERDNILGKKVTIKGNIEVFSFREKMQTFFDQLDIFKIKYNNFLLKKQDIETSIIYDINLEEFQIIETETEIETEIENENE